MTRVSFGSYFEVIKNPMDLSTMSAKLDQGMYKDRAQFEKDFRLLIRNAKQYNTPKTAAYEDALELEKAFDIGMLSFTRPRNVYLTRI